MSREKITVRVGELSAIVMGDCQHGSIETRGSGQANVTHYEVRIAGHTLPGTWADDARHNTTVVMDRDHPLYAAIRKIASNQDALRLVKDMGRRAPIGWRDSEWDDQGKQMRLDYAQTKAAVESDPICQAILGKDAEAIA